MEEREEESKGGGCVYFIETSDGAFIKIGYSVNVPQRFDQIGILLPGLRLIGYMPGTFATESWLHAKFAPHRERGEWFRQTAEIRQFIANVGLLAQPQKAKAIARESHGEQKMAKAKNATKQTPTPTAKKNPAAVALGRLGGQKTGVKGLAAMTPEQRKEIAAKGLATRRAKAKKKAKAKNI